MSGGTNGPLVYDGAPYQFESKTLSQLRTKLMIRLGFAAQLAYPPPGMEELLNDFLIDAQEQMYARYAPLRTRRWWPITVTQGNRHYDIPSISTKEISVTFADGAGLGDVILRHDGGDYRADGFTPGMPITVTNGGANNLLTYTVSTVVAGILTLIVADSVNVEGPIDSIITSVDYKSLDMLRVTEQWVQDGSTWNKMREGIDPNRFNETGQAWPQDYEWSDHLEIWPEPDKTYTIWVWGHFGLLPFAADTDVTTIEWELVNLMALATAKAHYGQKDAGTYYRQLEVYLRRMNKQRHGNHRYIPEPNIKDHKHARAKPEATWR